MAIVIDSRVGVEAIIQTKQGRWLAFADPVRVLGAEASGVRAVLREVERLTRDAGVHAVGFVTYEAGSAFGLPACSASADLPAVWFAFFDPKSVRSIDRPVAGAPYDLGVVHASLERASFGRAFDEVKRRIAAGDTYQANLTFKMTARFDGEPRSLFADLVKAQQGRYSAYVSFGHYAICSASPELFFELDGAEQMA